jgi:hypothetical protein
MLGPSSAPHAGSRSRFAAPYAQRSKRKTSVNNGVLDSMSVALCDRKLCRKDPEFQAFRFELRQLGGR